MRHVPAVSLIRALTLACAIPAITFSAEPFKPFAEQFQPERFTVDGRQAFLIRPKGRDPKPTPWVMYAPTLGKSLPGDAETWMFERFLARGIAIAGVDVGESFGSPQGRKTYHALHHRLVSEEGFDGRACLLARSRGGLMLYCWAADNPRKVKRIAGIYPVCNLTSYPGLKRACGAYRMTEAELAAGLEHHNPVDRLKPLVEAGVPILHIHGDADKVVPLADNSALMQKRYEALGGSMQLTIAKDQWHNMWPGFFECGELVDFVVKHAHSDPRVPQ